MDMLGADEASLGGWPCVAEQVSWVRNSTDKKAIIIDPPILVPREYLILENKSGSIRTGVFNVGERVTLHESLMLAGGALLNVMACSRQRPHSEHPTGAFTMSDKPRILNEVETTQSKLIILVHDPQGLLVDSWSVGLSSLVVGFDIRRRGASTETGSDAWTGLTFDVNLILNEGCLRTINFVLK